MTSTPPRFLEGEFRKATRSEPHQNCVQVARRDGWVELRDDKTTFGAADDHRLVLTDEQFDTFLADTRSGHPQGRCLAMIRHADGGYTLRGTGPQPASTELTFTEHEIAAFRHGITNGEFDRR